MMDWFTVLVLAYVFASATFHPRGIKWVYPFSSTKYQPYSSISAFAKANACLSTNIFCFSTNVFTVQIIECYRDVVIVFIDVCYNVSIIMLIVNLIPFLPPRIVALRIWQSQS